MLTLNELAAKRITFLGIGREARAFTRFAVPRGAELLLSDLKPAEKLLDTVEALSDLAVRYVFGSHPLEILDCDWLFVSPGVPLDTPIVVEAMRRGIPIGSETGFFMTNCPAPVAAITGSSGKTTTTRLVSECMLASGSKVWTGGNIGDPLTPCLDQIRKADRVVMELSSFQLQLMDRSPQVAAILNVTPNHLDRHASMDEYIAAKRRMIQFQEAADYAVLGYDNEITRSIAAQAPGRVAMFSMEKELGEGAFLRHQQIVLRLAGMERVICHERDVQLLGRHNVQNVLAACAIAALHGADPAAMWEVILSFRGVEHRLELVREIDGVAFYNDSIATSPERAAAALRAFDRPIVLLAGGQDKHLPWDELANLILKKTRAVVLFGQAADLIDGALVAAKTRIKLLSSSGPVVRRAASLQEAVGVAYRLAQPGDVVLLSPGGTSFDGFKDFVERGEVFKTLVRAL